MPFELVPPGTSMDFIGKRRLCAALSLGLIAASIAAVFTRGVQLGIDFAGGTEVQVRFAEGVEVGEGSIRSVLTSCGMPKASVVRYGGSDVGSEFLIRFGEAQAPQPGGAPADCPITAEDRDRLAEVAKRVGLEGGETDAGELVDRIALGLRALGALELQRVEFVGPRVGAELRRAGVEAILYACLLILGYVAFRFSARFAPGAIAALVHDIGITAGLFVILGLEFDLRVLAALLAILGYSLNDTIVIYDRIRENMERRTKLDLPDVLNRSVNQTLSRTVLTSTTTLAAVLALLLLGGEVIRPFAIAMVIGIAVGTYSSVFIAAPTLLFLETRLGGGAGDSGRPRA